jgi:hypothetical protein
VHGFSRAARIRQNAAVMACGGIVILIRASLQRCRKSFRFDRPFLGDA